MIAALVFLLLVSVLANIGQLIHGHLTRLERDEACEQLNEAAHEIDHMKNAVALRAVSGRQDKRARMLGLIEGARQ